MNESHLNKTRNKKKCGVIEKMQIIDDTLLNNDIYLINMLLALGYVEHLQLQVCYHGNEGISIKLIRISVLGAVIEN